MRRTLIVHRLLIVLAYIGLGGIAGCAVNNITAGRPIEDDKVKQIIRGQSTADEVIELFGAPTQQSEMAGNLLYTYRYSVTKGSGLALPFFSSSGAKEESDELTITFDKATGRVKTYSVQRGIGA